MHTSAGVACQAYFCWLRSRDFGFATKYITTN
ncbi:hypothetical protein CGLO_15110 [Colletotrichum gloeosporioides Cg-14]|uniref:Uncharacterized protein n=1 Tax=Colletotrichum gloeosporioides (strain Cg-14) TaxID=1237896 RepID=T0LCB1_COLGC|nr:hypothetical protein CGLO_15110 [Colletotrichum gloeosporioides Cg-14]